MLQSALVFGAITFVLALLTTFVSPICTPCIAIFAGFGAGYVAAVFSRPPASGAAAKSGALAGGISAVAGLAGQMIGGLVNAVFMGPEQAGAVFRRMFQLSPDLGTRAPNSFYYLGALGIPCCVGLADIALMAALGAVGGIVWYQVSGKHPVASHAISSG